MENDTLLKIGYLFIVYFLSAIAGGIVVFLALAPSQYNPYRVDLIEEEEETVKDESNKPGEAYAHFNKHRNTNKSLRVETSVQIVVLGDIGRSPRMQYHALSLAKHGARVDLIGFNESDIHPELLSRNSVTVVPLTPPPFFLQIKNKLAFVVVGPLKAVWQALNLYWVLGYKTKPAKWMLVQNPPSIPVLLIAKVICVQRNTKLIIDWHNYGWSVLGLKLGHSHPLVIVAKLYEYVFGRGAEVHFAVTQAMATALSRSLQATVLPLHDRPASTFQPLSYFQRSAVLSRLEQTATHAPDIERGSTRLLVSSTSWTPDEDFSLLLDALVSYSEKATMDKTLPYVLVIITGKGPQKEAYLRKIRTLTQANKLQRVTILTAWLEFNDYAALLGAADLGISLHKSTSGVDLPMKVVDMFGAGLPVVGYSAYESWSEVVKEGVNGRGFKSAEDLTRLLEELLRSDGVKLKEIKNGAIAEGKRRWDDDWDEVAGKKVFRFPKLLDPIATIGSNSTATKT